MLRGYIDIGSERFILDDDTKKRLTDTADKLHEQQEEAIMLRQNLPKTYGENKALCVMQGAFLIES